MASDAQRKQTSMIDAPLVGLVGRRIEKQLPGGQTIEFTLGDINGDGQIDQDDIELLRHLVEDTPIGQFLRERMGAEELMACDLNGDGSVDQGDLALLCNKLITELEHLSYTDELTGLPNRRGLKEKGRLKVLAARRFNQRLACLALDIDHFKRVNDTHGHDVGDLVLRKVADVLRANSRNSDVLARIGGEEFIVLLDDASDEVAMMLADRIRTRIAEAEVALASGEVLSVTVSIGVAPYDPRMSLQMLIKQADLSLYRAKHTGRNRVCLSGPGDSAPALPPA
ncbi:MAG: diguanylate cyclase [Xanthomonadales bacterium]|nr:diguanylate cyclase [Xanthomonadales bacterium]